MQEIFNSLTPEFITIILTYFVPGLVFLKIFNFMCSKENMQENVVVYSIAISYVINGMINYGMNRKFVVFYLSYEFITYILPILIAIVGAFISSKIYLSKRFDKFVFKTSRKTLNKSIWRDVLDLEKGCLVTAYMKEGDFFYGGIIDKIEENGNDSWFSLARYSVYNNDRELQYDFEDDNSHIMLLNLADVRKIEIAYEKSSQYIKS